MHRANLVINTLPEKVSDQLPQAEVDLLVGEAKFLRAWAYFELITYWGNVPFSLETVEDFTGGVPLADSEQVIRDQIIEDLKAAEEFLPRVSEYRGTENLGRATQGSAQTLLGRAYMYFGDFASARTVLQKVIDSGDYALAPNYEDNHREENENNIESIFEVQFERVLANVWGGPQKAVQYRTQEYTPFIWHNVVPRMSWWPLLKRVILGINYVFSNMGIPMGRTMRMSLQRRTLHRVLRTVYIGKNTVTIIKCPYRKCFQESTCVYCVMPMCC